MNKIIIKLVSPHGQDTKRYRAFSASASLGGADYSLGVAASCTSDPASIGAGHCAAKAFIKFAEPTADRDEIETRIALKEIAPGCGIWEATLHP